MFLNSKFVQLENVQLKNVRLENSQKSYCFFFYTHGADGVVINKMATEAHGSPLPVMVRVHGHQVVSFHGVSHLKERVRKVTIIVNSFDCLFICIACLVNRRMT